MDDPVAYGTLTSIDARPTLRFELDLAHPVQRVWRAVSDPAELAQFFPGAAPWTPIEGETIDLGGATLTVTKVAEPQVLAWTMGDQPQAFEIAESDNGSRLLFTHVIDDLPAAQTATGWQTYLSRLAPHLAGGHLSEEAAHSRWRALHELYAEKFGVDPTPGRQWAEANLPEHD